MDKLFKLFGLVTQKDLNMLRDDLRNEMAGLGADLDALEVRLNEKLAEASGNSVQSEDVNMLVALRAKVNAFLATE